MKKRLRKIHKFLGFSVGIFFVLSGLTGSLLVYKTELDQFLHEELYTVRKTVEQEVSFQEMYDSVINEFPSQKILFIKNVRPLNGTVEFWLEGDRIAHVNPYTGDVQGSRHELDTFMGWVADFHIHLFSGETGELIVGVLGFVCSLLVSSGLYLWWPGREKVFSRLSWYRGASKVRWYFQNHKVFGVFSSPLMLFSSLTGGLIVFYPFIAGLVIMLTKSDLGSLKTMAGVPAYERQNTLTLDKLIDLGKKDLKESKMTWVYLPQNNQTAAIVRYKTLGELHPNGNNYVFLKPTSGEISKAVYATAVPFVIKLLNQVYPLHVGKVGFSLFRFYIFLSGFAPLFMFYTAYRYNRLRVN